MQKKSKSKVYSLTLYHILLSYIVAFLIPTIILTLLIRVGIMNEVFRKERQSIRNELEYARITLDQQIGNFSDVANLAFVDNEIGQYVNENDLPENYKEFVALQKSLRKLVASNTLIDELLLYVPESDCFVSTKSSYLLKNYVNIVALDRIATEAELYEYLNTYSEYRILHGTKQATGKALTMQIYSLKNSYTTRYPVLLFLTEASSYQSALKKAVGNRTGAAILSDPDGNIVSSFCNDPGLDCRAFAELISSDSASFEKEVVSRENYLLSAAQSSSGNLIYSIVIDENSIRGETSYLNFMWLGLVAITLIFGLLIALMLGYRSYKPIDLLQNRAKTLYSGPDLHSDAFQYLSDTLDYMNMCNEKLQNSLEDSNHYLIIRLLNGSLSEEDGMHLLSAVFGVQLDHAAFRVLLFQSVDTQLSARSIEARLRTGLPPHTNVLMLREESETIAVLIYDRSALDGTLPLPEIPGSFQAGSIQTSIQNVPLSYAEVVVGTVGNPYCNEIDVQLEQAIQAKDMQKIADLLQQIGQKAASTAVSLNEIKLLAVHYLLVLKKTAKASGTQHLIMSMPEPYTVLRYESREELVDFFKRYHADFIKSMILPNAVCGETLNSRMLKYLQEHYSDPNFSLQQMSDDFKLTPLTLSRQFLEFNGQTPSDYMTNFRIETAKMLLTTTNRSVNQIATEVGYYNVNSFIRRFGQITGVTPGKFKSQISKKQ